VSIADAPSAPGVTTLPARADGLTGFDVQFASGARTRCISGAGSLPQLPALAAEVGLTGTSGFLCDAQLVFLQRPLVDALGKALGGTLARAVREDRKQLVEVEAMTDVLSQRGLDRGGFVVALGGGVLTDLAGLAAALYLRGVPWVSAPTTLLSQVDAGLGGKTGANLRSGKNLVGAFHQPRLVVCDPNVLATLPPRERWSGLAEIVKCALLDPNRDAFGEPFLARCERTLEEAALGNAAALDPLIAASIRIKAEIVAVDEREGESKPVVITTKPARPAPMLRAYLNLGHTVGHAIEAASGYGKFAHGEAVALGLRGMLALSKALGVLSAEDAARGLALVDRLQIEPLVQLTQDERKAALGALARDKKVREGKVRFVLLAGLGSPQLVPVSPEEAAYALDQALARPRPTFR
jgi:3-dehydroquinate synthetase